MDIGLRIITLGKMSTTEVQQIIRLWAYFRF